MKILLDTHILVWFHLKDNELSEKAWKILLDPENEIYYSSINIWETQIKHLKHEKEINFSGDDLNKMSIAAGLKCLHLRPEHCIELKSLVYDEKNAPHPHKDPFDRILICQAKAENMLLMTHDSLIPFYNEPCILSV
ncbi:MAG: type II toxin-antitoxin system VapC family toxin [Treponema sp.]|nr:type II toxin-antitoxin system VapC family toxin [Treponema sp.]